MINGVSPGMTPTTHTNALGHCQTEMDTWNASSHASDSAGHLGLALQAFRFAKWVCAQSATAAVETA